MKIYEHNGKSNIIGPRVIAARKNLGLTQDNLAARMQLENIEMNQKVISRIETQVRFVADYELVYLAKVLNVSVNWLLGAE